MSIMNWVVGSYDWYNYWSNYRGYWLDFVVVIVVGWCSVVVYDVGCNYELGVLFGVYMVIVMVKLRVVCMGIFDWLVSRSWVCW